MKRITLMSSFLAMLLLLPVLLAVAEEYTWEPGSQGFTNLENPTTITINDNITAVWEAGTNTQNIPIYYQSGRHIRFYNSNIVTFTAPAGNVFTKIEFTISSGTFDAGVSSGEFTQSANTWTGNASTVSFTQNNAGQVRITGIKFTYEESTTTEEPGTGGSEVEEPGGGTEEPGDVTGEPGDGVALEAN